MSPTLMQSRLDSRNQTTSTANRETVLAVVVPGRPAVSTDAAEEVVPETMWSGAVLASTGCIKKEVRRTAPKSSDSESQKFRFAFLFFPHVSMRG